MNNDALACFKVTVRHPHAKTDAIRDCSFHIGQGEKVGLVGLNGSGKTSLLYALCGLLASTGEIVVDGIPLSAATLAGVRERIGFLFSIPDVQLLLPTVEEDVAWGLRSRGVLSGEAFSRAARVLDQLGIADLRHAVPQELSQGERLRTALAGVFAPEPVLALLDEPSASLDPPGKRMLAAFLRQQPGAHLLASHDLGFCRRSCDRWILLRRGVIVAQTTDPGVMEEWMSEGGRAEEG